MDVYGAALMGLDNVGLMVCVIGLGGGGTVGHMGGRVDFTLTPVSGTGTGFDPLLSRERGFCWLVLACCMPHHSPLDCGSSPQ